jgi:hypothetical protein
MEADSKQAQEIMRLVHAGTDPEEAYAKVMSKVDKDLIPPTMPAKRTMNTEPDTKKKLRAWLENWGGEVIPEYQFHRVRRWRFDFFLPHYSIAIEYEGFMQMGSNAAHSAVTGIMRDVEKYNEAQAMGIRVFRCHAENIRTGKFFELMERVLGEER